MTKSSVNVLFKTSVKRYAILVIGVGIFISLLIVLSTISLTRVLFSPIKRVNAIPTRNITSARNTPKSLVFSRNRTVTTEKISRTVSVVRKSERVTNTLGGITAFVKS